MGDMKFDYALRLKKQNKLDHPIDKFPCNSR